MQDFRSVVLNLFQEIQITFDKQGLFSLKEMFNNASGLSMKIWDHEGLPIQ